MMEKKVFKIGSSRLQKYFFAGVDIVCLLIAIYSGYNIRENPPVVIAVIVFMLGLILVPKEAYITIESGAIEFVDKNRWIKKISKRRSFLMNDISFIDANLQLSRKRFILIELLGSSMIRMSYDNTLVIGLKNGEEFTFSTDIYKEYILTSLEEIKKITNGSVVISVG